MVSVLKALPVEAVWDGGQDWHEPRYRRFFQTLLEQHVPWSVVRAGSQAELERGLWLDVLGPPETPYRGTHSDCNNNSVVVRLRYGTFSMLLAGDLEREAELGLVRDRPEALRATVLKVSHHGSRFGSNPEFLAAVRPKACLISVGAHNLFHHPSPDAIARLRRYGPVYRTDLDGAITVHSDGVGWGLETVHSGRARVR